jgi:hypothetical protein
MFKSYNVADSLWQMNFFMALQVSRLSTLSYLAEKSSEAEEEPEIAEEEVSPAPLRQRNAA